MPGLITAWQGSEIRSFSVHSDQVKVIDGDTIRVENLTSSIRVFGIDAPEISQKSFAGREIGKFSRDFVKEQLQNRWLEIVLVGRGYYGRRIGRIFYTQKNQKLELSSQLLKSGHAVIYPYSRFSTWAERLKWGRWQLQAQRQRKGVWKTKGFYSPKKHRKSVGR